MSDVPQEIVLDERLAGELRRRGIEVHAGDRVRLQLVSQQEQNDQEIAAWEAFVGGFTSEESDLAERSEDIPPSPLCFPDQRAVSPPATARAPSKQRSLVSPSVPGGHARTTWKPTPGDQAQKIPDQRRSLPRSAPPWMGGTPAGFRVRPISLASSRVADFPIRARQRMVTGYRVSPVRRTGRADDS